MKGPVPTGFWFAGLVMKSVPAYRCLGIMGAKPGSNISMKAGKAVFSLMTTVLASGAVTESTNLFRMTRARACVLGSISASENTTSSDVNGLPSCHLTLSCRWKV
ncbi:hypothetical protein D3C87_1829200 [compost metagenome]